MENYQEHPAESHDETGRDEREPDKFEGNRSPRIKETNDAIYNEVVSGKHATYSNCKVQSVEECDLAAQQSMAKSTAWMNYAAWVAAILTFVGVVLLAGTLRYTKKAAISADEMVNQARLTTKAADETVRITKEIGERELRPWVALDFDVISWEWRSENAGGLLVNLTAKNVGKSVALHVRAKTHIYDILDDWEEAKQARDDLLGISGKMRWLKGNGALLPNETQNFRASCGFNFPPEIAHMWNGKKVFMPHFLLFCRYSDSAGNEYFTQRAVRLLTKSKGEGFIPFGCDELGPDDFIKEAIGPSMAT